MTSHTLPGRDHRKPDHVTSRELLARLAYGAVFAVLVPALLVEWARATADVVPLPPLHSALGGAALVAVGLVLMSAGAWALHAWGDGLPMNAFPPRQLVERGIYAWLSHPIYLGFVLAVFGVAIYAGSPSGLWLVAPLALLGCVALVEGYERQDMLQRFGVGAARAKVSLPRSGEQAPLLRERLLVHVLVLWPWLLLFWLTGTLGDPPDAIASYLPGEQSWPVLEWTEYVYVTVYAAVALAPFVARTGTSLRRFALRGLAASAIVFPLYLALPFVCPHRPFVVSSLGGHMLLLERALDSTREALPSFHVVWAALAAALFAERWPRARWLAWLWVAAVAVSCVTAGVHGTVDIAAGLVVALAILKGRAVWRAIRGASERVANSWREWRIGRVRVINHGVYGGLAAGLGTWIAGTAAGPHSTLALVLIVVTALICSALWAQLVEGSAQLLRPYGFFGGVIGIILGASLSPLVGASTWLMLGAFSLAAPWVQSIGRLRCLVQGCCHGAPTSPEVGIRYTHPRSRVTRLAHLDGVPLHPTPVYSMLWNVVIALVLTRLWSLHAPLHLVGGLYLILMGLGRFVEEAYRGEPQTPIYYGLRFYQWLAIVSVLVGILTTMLGRGAPAPAPALALAPALVAVPLALLGGAALGVDFPDSNRRFSRLV